MEITPITLEGQHVRLEPMSRAHEEALIAAAADGELWNSTVTIVPSRATIGAYIATALNAQAEGTRFHSSSYKSRGQDRWQHPLFPHRARSPASRNRVHMVVGKRSTHKGEY